MELLRVGKRLEQQGSGIFIDLWPLVLGFCGRGWFEPQGSSSSCNDSPMSMDLDATSASPIQSIGASSDESDYDSDEDEDDHYLDLPVLS